MENFLMNLSLESGLLMFFVCFVIFGVLTVFIINCIQMAKDPGFHPWPAVTRCRLCDNRVFVWQKYERRDSNVKLDNPQQVACFVSGSSIVHKACSGNPEVKMTVTKKVS